MNGEELKAALRAGQRVCGTMFVTTRVGAGDERLEEMGLDYVIIDNEHAPFSRPETADWMKRLVAQQIVPIVRVPIPSSHYVTMALDGGAQGVLTPYVETVAQVREVVGAAKFLPLKGDAVEKAVAGGEFPSEETRQFLEERNRNNLLIIGIESVAALERLDELLAVPGVDAAFVGPNDLTIQLGVPAQYQHPKYEEAVGRIHDTCTARGVPLVIHFFSYEMAEPWIAKGVKLVLFGTDRGGIADQMQADFAHLRGLPGG
ncbi:MAG: aldolase/citrate lyase family protein [SAR324 cluster bacterium]|nr:aldolase/citrate lyase family protein [SAR324 cluster bacterium]